jgi:hypothetical protein
LIMAMGIANDKPQREIEPELFVIGNMPGFR